MKAIKPMKTSTIQYVLYFVMLLSLVIPPAISTGLISSEIPSPTVRISTFLSYHQITVLGDKTMEHQENRPGLPGHSSVFDRLKTIKRDQSLLHIEQLLREINEWENPKVQQLYRRAKFGTDFGKKKALEQLVEFIQSYYDLRMRLEDAFMPFATVEQISNGGRGVHILNQVYNNIGMYAPLESFPLCWLLLGPQGAGKSSAAFHILQQLSIPTLIFDPKGTWRFRAAQLRSENIEAEYIAFDLTPPPNIKLQLWLYAYMEGVAYITGLQYAVGYLYEACDIVIEQHRKYLEQTGVNVPLCLQDIYMALQLCISRNSKQAQYLESAKAALKLLIGKGELFENRGGLPLETLLNGNYILGCRYLTPIQLRLVAWHILNYEYFRSFNLPETSLPRGLIGFDDSSKVISRPDTVFGPGSKTSVYMHVLSTLRSTGRGAFFIDQLVEPICDDVKQLCNNWLVVGGMRGTRNQSEVASAMCLSRDQAAMLGRLQKREAICFCPSLYPYAVHGLIPVVSDPEGGNNQ